ncbi:Uncharacterised protein [Vibrio cholerae]|nr:Uncharacterised protein [Vibrio cholerae]
MLLCCDFRQAVFDIPKPEIERDESIIQHNPLTLWNG